MSEEQLRFPEWQGPLQDLILEFDRETMLAKVQEVEALIFERLRQLSASSDGRVEHEALHDALNVLRILKRDRLGFPDWK
jgi:inhibitor of KinA sporulation pathway (predicted exonuclease)